MWAAIDWLLNSSAIAFINVVFSIVGGAAATVIDVIWGIFGGLAPQDVTDKVTELTEVLDGTGTSDYAIGVQHIAGSLLWLLDFVCDVAYLVKVVMFQLLIFALALLTRITVWLLTMILPNSSN